MHMNYVFLCARACFQIGCVHAGVCVRALVHVRVCVHESVCVCVEGGQYGCMWVLSWLLSICIWIDTDFV